MEKENNSNTKQYHVILDAIWDQYLVTPRSYAPTRIFPNNLGQLSVTQPEIWCETKIILSLLINNLLQYPNVRVAPSQISLSFEASNDSSETVVLLINKCTVFSR
jgi:hypothetical protein